MSLPPNVQRSLAKKRKPMLSGWCESGNHDYCTLGTCPCGCHKTADAGVNVTEDTQASNAAPPVLGSKEAPEATTLVSSGQPAPASAIKPGLHFDLPNDDYHAQSDWLSSTQLKGYLPEHFEKSSGHSDAFDVGTAFHTRALGTDEQIEVRDFPTWRSGAAERERDAIRAAGAIPLLLSDSKMIDGMVASLRRHDEAVRLLHQPDAQPEVSAFTHDADGAPIKARFDLLAATAVDLKSTLARPSRSELARTVVNFGYDLSAAHYLDVAHQLDLDVTGFRLIFVGKKAPHPVVVVALDESFMDRGRALCALAKRRALHPLTEPAYEGASGDLTIAPPGWARITETTPAGIPADFTWSINDYS